MPDGDRYAWDADSTYVRNPPYFEGMPAEPSPVEDILGARVLAMLGDSVTTDHISPAGAIKKDSPAGHYLMNFGVSGGGEAGARRRAGCRRAEASMMRDVHGVEPKDFNSYGSRRGNHEVMVRGTFANIRLRNLLAPGTEGGVTRHLPARRGDDHLRRGDALRSSEGTPLVVLAGKEYGSGSSRDWAAKGTRLLGVRAVIAESFERIHRSNLVGMGVLPLQFCDGETAKSLGLSRPGDLRDHRLAGPLNAGELPRHATVNAGNIEFQARRPHRHAEGGGLLPPRRDPAVRAAPARGRRVTLGRPAAQRERAEAEREQAEAEGDRRRGRRARAVAGGDVGERLVGVGHRQDAGERVERAAHLVARHEQPAEQELGQDERGHELHGLELGRRERAEARGRRPCPARR